MHNYAGTASKHCMSKRKERLLICGAELHHGARFKVQPAEGIMTSRECDQSKTTQRQDVFEERAANWFCSGLMQLQHLPDQLIISLIHPVHLKASVSPVALHIHPPHSQPVLFVKWQEVRGTLSCDEGEKK